MAAGVLFSMLLIVIIIVLIVQLSKVNSNLKDIESGRIIPGPLYNKIYQEAEESIKHDLYIEFLDALKEKSIHEIQEKIENELRLLNDKVENRKTRRAMYQFLNMMGDVRANLYKDD